MLVERSIGGMWKEGWLMGGGIPPLKREGVVRGFASCRSRHDSRGGEKAAFFLSFLFFLPFLCEI